MKFSGLNANNSPLKSFKTDSKSLTTSRLFFKSNQKDVYESQNNDKKKQNTKRILAGLSILGVGVVAACLILKNRGKDVVEAGSDIVEKSGDEIAEQTLKQDNPKQLIADSLDNPQFKTNAFYQVTPTVVDKNSVQDDLTAWIKKLKEAPLKSSDGYNLNAVDDIGLENIKPHNYTNTSDILMSVKEYRIDFPPSRMVVDDELKFLSEPHGRFFDLVDKNFDYDNHDLFIGKDPNGKAFVTFRFTPTRQDFVGRPQATRIMLRSKTGEFNQDQLDLIEAYKKNQDLKNTGNPLGLSFLMPKETAHGDTSELQFNKNMFLSLIQHLANK